MGLSISQMSSGIDPGWLASAWVRMRNTSSAGIIGALQNPGNGSISSFLSRMQSSAGNLATISQNNLTNRSNLIAQMASQTLQEQGKKKLEEAIKSLVDEQSKVQPTNVLDPYIYFIDGSYIDTENNILTMSDGTKYDTVTGSKYVDPATIIQMSNGGYLNTSTNILTMPDGTQIDTVTGLQVSQLSSS